MGMGRSVPISSLHVQRTSTPLFNAAVCEIQGFRDTQEDAHNIIENVNQHGIMLFGVYDGHGGSLCSKYLSEEIPTAFSKLDRIDNSQQITQICIEVDRRFLATGKQDGSTCCIVLAQLFKKEDDTPIEDYNQYLTTINNNRETFVAKTRIKVVSVNIGDSRAVILRKLALFPDLDPVTGQPCDDDSLDDSAYFEPITIDHKPTDPSELKRIMQAGGFVEMGRVDGSLALSRAFGDSAYKTPREAPEEKQKVTVVPEFQVHYMDWGDVLFVSCDGIFEAEPMSYSEVAQELVLSVIKGSKLQNDLIATTAAAAKTIGADGEKDMGDIDADGAEKGNNDGEKTTMGESQRETDGDGADKTGKMGNDNDKGDGKTIPPTDAQLYNFDPALPCRDIIQRSLESGSKDNHTALIVSFKPPMFETKTITALPQSEIIPSPFTFHSSDRNFEADYLTDLGMMFNDDLRHLIYDLDQLWDKHNYQYHNNTCIEAVKTRLIESNHSPLLPIMYGSYGAQPHQQPGYHMNPYGGMGHFSPNYDDDDDDDDEYHSM